MSRRAIGKSAFIATLVAIPGAVCLSYPLGFSDGDRTDIAAIGIAFYIITAVRLDSWMISGALLGAWAGTMLGEDTTHFDPLKRVISQSICAVVGAACGSFIDFIRKPPENPDGTGACGER